MNSAHVKRARRCDVQGFATRWSKIVAALVALSGAGCVSREAQTRAQFSSEVTCPESRVAVAQQILLTTPTAPPPEIAADPERLQMWRERDEARRAVDREKQYFSAQGCGQRRIYHCYYCVSRPGKTNCGMIPSCVEQSACSEVASHPGYIGCAGR